MALTNESTNSLASSFVIYGVKRAPPAAPGIVSKRPMPRSWKVRFKMVKSSEIDDLALSYSSAKCVSETKVRGRSSK